MCPVLDLKNYFVWFPGIDYTAPAGNTTKKSQKTLMWRVVQKSVVPLGAFLRRNVDVRDVPKAE